MRLVLLALLLAGCSPHPGAQPAAQPAVTPPAEASAAPYVFRNEDRPAYTRTLPAADLAKFRSEGGRIIDVRLAEDFAADPSLVTGADRQDPEKIASWAGELRPGQPVAVYCVKGKWVSQKAAAYLASRGIDVYSVEGGLEAWKALPAGG